MVRSWVSDLSETSTNCGEPKADAGSGDTLRLCGKESLYSEFCLCNQSGRRRDQRLVCTGRSHLPLLYALCKLKEQHAWNAFYAPHRRTHDPLHNDDYIYTPGVMAFKSDTDYPQLLPEEKWYSVNVMTCAAPNLRERPSNEMNAGDGDAAVHISREDLQALHEKRMRRVLEIAWRKGNEVVILGAFGCGAFRNPPAVVAQAMKTVVQEYRKNFETIEFAVYCSTQYDANYRVFQQTLGGL